MSVCVGLIMFAAYFFVISASPFKLLSAVLLADHFSRDGSVNGICSFDPVKECGFRSKTAWFWSKICLNQVSLLYVFLRQDAMTSVMQLDTQLATVYVRRDKFRRHKGLPSSGSTPSYEHVGYSNSRHPD